MSQRELIVAPNESLPAPSNAPLVSGNTANVLNLIQHGIDKGMTPEAMSQLVALHERVMAKQAEQEFSLAKKAFQFECPIIGKNRTAKIKTKAGVEYGYTFADLAHVAEMIRPLLDKHGFSYSFDQDYDKGTIKVSCTLRHVGGHKETTTFSGPTDTAAAMSDMQKAGAATTFARRYTLVLALGLPIGEDDDARLPHENPEQRPDAPQVKPRGQRNEAARVTKDQLAAIVTEWKTTQRDEPTREAFAAWAVETVGFSDWNPNKEGDWSQEFVAVCHKALGML